MRYMTIIRPFLYNKITPLVQGDKLGVPVVGILRNTPLCWIIDINKSEALIITAVPFKIIRERPVEITKNFITTLTRL